MRIALYNTLKVCSKHGLLACSKKILYQQISEAFQTGCFSRKSSDCCTLDTLLTHLFCPLGNTLGYAGAERGGTGACCANWHHPSWHRPHLISLLKEMCWTPLIIHQTTVLLFCPWKIESLRLQFTNF